MATIRRLNASGEWLCRPGPYQQYISASGNFNPGFQQPDTGNEAAPVNGRQAAATLLVVDDDTQTIRRSFDLEPGEDLIRLKTALRSPREGARSIWLIEGLNPDLVAILGEHFEMDPSFFLDHERTSRWRRKPEEPGLLPPLPSAREPRRLCCLPYCEIREFWPMKEGYSISCADTGRCLWRTKWQDEWSSTCIVDRKCCFWSRYAASGGWDVVILCDPPVRRLHFWEETERGKWTASTVPLLYNEPFQGGYRDFVPRSGVVRNLPPGPSRESLREDLCYYLENHSDLSPDSFNGPLAVSWFLRKIVASHYMQVIRYNAGILRSLEWPLLRQDSLSIEMRQAEGKWSELQTTASSCNNYVEDLEEAMLSLGIDSHHDPEMRSPTSWAQDDADFRYLLSQAKSLTTRVTELNNAFTGLTSIIGNEQANAEAKRSILEAKSVKVLTLLATIFIPLSFTCGLFSMSDEYLPGSTKFWIFFAVSVPLVILMFVIAELIDFAWLRPQLWNVVRHELDANRRVKHAR